MLTRSLDILQEARKRKYALGAFNIYNLEGVRAVVMASEAARSPAILQILPAAIKHSGYELFTYCLESAKRASTPISVHLDHCPDLEIIKKALESGVSSVMADGSSLSFDENLQFVRKACELTSKYGAAVECELGKLAGNEDGMPHEEIESRLTDPGQAREFLHETGAQILAVSIGNVHGQYAATPKFDLDRLTKIRELVDAPLALHGASGVPADLVRSCIELGVCKFNVNTEVRAQYVKALQAPDNSGDDLLALQTKAIEAMRTVILEKMELFGSVGRA